VHADTLYTLFNSVGQTPSGFIQVGATFHREGTDFFTNGVAVTITGATLRLNNQDSIDHTVTASLWSGEGAPATLVGSFDPITIPTSFTFANFSFSSAGIGLAANSAYWMVLQINEGTNTDAVGWQTTSSEETDAGSVFSAIADTTMKYSTDSGASWDDNFTGPGNFQFSLMPEPARWAQLGVGVLALGLLRRRKA
jgi:hypothetical protein